MSLLKNKQIFFRGPYDMWTGTKMLLQRFLLLLKMKTCSLRGFFSEQLDDLGGRTLRSVSKLLPSKRRTIGKEMFLPRATSFNLTPFTYTTLDGRNGGWEARIMETVAESLNFRQNSFAKLYFGMKINCSL